MDAQHMPPHYKRAHKIQNDLVITSLRKSEQNKLHVVVDLGCGTANDGIDILSRTENEFYLGVDNSVPMIERAKCKMQSRAFEKRSYFLIRDFRQMSVMDITGTLSLLKLECRIKAVMSTLALHHYELEEKRHVYTLAHNLLPPGGRLVLTDLFSNGIQGCAQYALYWEIDQVCGTIENSKEKPIDSKLATTRSVDHYLRSNRPQRLLDEVGVLHDCGFAIVDIVYRSGQLSVIVAQTEK